MAENAFFNIDSSLGAADVDAINKDFYGEINYPWAPMVLPAFRDSGFWPSVMNHELGRSGTAALRSDMRIWVAGCGTNQAALTALRFPGATVVGSDVSSTSLATCRKLADDVGIENLELREESLNEIPYREEFDHVVCTGVVHHNADPGATLRRVGAALKPDGVMELMVYNFYHRIPTTAYQKAIRLLAGSGSAPNIEAELPITRSLIENFPVENQLSAFLKEQRSAPPAAIADYFLQPVEYSYTVSTFADLCRDSNLSLLSYCVNQFDNMNGRSTWYLDLQDPAVSEAYEALDDLSRWQVTNLLLGEVSPLLWFYVQRADCSAPRRTDAEARQSFLNTIYMPRSTEVEQFRRQGERYASAGQAMAFPVPRIPTDGLARQVFENCDGYRPIRIILKALGIEERPALVEKLRSALVTTGNPYLQPQRAEG
jgi:SAM-dependent methyltransferase